MNMKFGKKLLAMVMAVVCLTAAAMPAMAATNGNVLGEEMAVEEVLTAVDLEAEGITQEELSAYANKRFVAPQISRNAAAAQTELACYTDYYKNKPAVYVYWNNTNYNPDGSKLDIWFRNHSMGWFCTLKDDWGINTYSPQAFPLVNGWQVYFIATRFMNMHINESAGDDWNNDANWAAYYTY